MAEPRDRQRDDRNDEEGTVLELLSRLVELPKQTLVDVVHDRCSAHFVSQLRAVLTSLTGDDDGRAPANSKRQRTRHTVGTSVSDLMGELRRSATRRLDTLARVDRVEVAKSELHVALGIPAAMLNVDVPEAHLRTVIDHINARMANTELFTLLCYVAVGAFWRDLKKRYRVRTKEEFTRWLAQLGVPHSVGWIQRMIAVAEHVSVYPVFQLASISFSKLADSLAAIRGHLQRSPSEALFWQGRTLSVLQLGQLREVTLKWSVDEPTRVPVRNDPIAAKEHEVHEQFLAQARAQQQQQQRNVDGNECSPQSPVSAVGSAIARVRLDSS